MKKYAFLPVVLLLVISCKMVTNADRQFGQVNENKIYRLHLNPANDSKYYYDISNQSEIKLELSDSKIDNLNKTTVGVIYSINRDSTGNFKIALQYDRLKIFTKSGDSESEMDAANAALTINPVEKMLGILKQAVITANVSQTGELKSITGYEELTSKIMAQLGSSDVYTRETARKQWEQSVGKGIIRNNLDQLFKIFPDSAVHIGDKWKLNISQGDELGLNAKASFILKGIEGDNALISSSGEIKSDGDAVSLMGQEVTTKLQGHQEGEYEMNIKSGMLVKSTITATVEGILLIMGKEVPVNIKTSVDMKGKEMK